MRNFLPANKDERAEAIVQMAERARSHSNPDRVRWKVAWYWLHGYRDFSINYETGVVEARLRNTKDIRGELHVQYEDVLNKRQTEIGRLARMNLLPLVEPYGFGLNSIRLAAAGRVLLSYLLSEVNINRHKINFLTHLVDYGIAGSYVWSRPHASLAGLETTPGDTGSGVSATKTSLLPGVNMEVVPGWQLLSIPHKVIDRQDTTGIIRERWVPLPWLREQEGMKFPSNPEALDIVVAPPGTTPSDTQIIPDATSDSPIALFKEKPSPEFKGKGATVDYVKCRESWFYDENPEVLERYNVTAGHAELLDRDLTGANVYCPMGVANYFRCGFNGRSFVDAIISLAIAAEETLSSLVQNVIDMDNYGLLLVNNNANVPISSITDRTKRRKVLSYEPDYMAMERGHKPVEAIVPLTSNDFPGKVFASLVGAIDRVSGQPQDLLHGEAPGRVDNAQGLGLLHEISSTILTVPALSVEEALVQNYKCLLSRAPDLVTEPYTLPLNDIDDSLMGLLIHPNSGKITLTPQLFPAPHQVKLTVKDRDPKPSGLRVAQLKESLAGGLITPLDFKITVWKEKLDYPVASWGEEASYRKAVLQCIMMFGDGETPNQVIVSAPSDNYEIHLKIITIFMAKPEFQFASQRVRDEFEKLKEDYKSLSGKGIPAPLGYPEDEAEIMAAAQGPPNMGSQASEMMPG